MLVMILERVTPWLRGELSRWLIEPKVGVFVGDASGMVRDQLWEKCSKHVKNGALMQLWSTNNEQGFAMRALGDTSRHLRDYDGLRLICIPWPKDDSFGTPKDAMGQIE